MQDYDRAIADLHEIRTRMAAGTVFRGLGAAALAASAGLALFTATLQHLLLPAADALPAFFAGWIVTAVLSAALLGAEAIARSRRHHAGLADAMIHNAVGQFLPAGVAGAALAAVIARFSPESAWMLPGLWQVLIGLGVFAAARSLPRGAVLAGAWYFVAGFAVLMLAADDPVPSPWMMGVPFAVGQLLLAAIVRRASGDGYDGI